MRLKRQRKIYDFIVFSMLAAGLLPVLFIGVLFFAEAALGMRNTLKDTKALELKEAMGDIESLSNQEAEGLRMRLGAMERDIRSLWQALWGILTHKEAYSGSLLSPILPTLDPATGQMLTPKETGFSLRLPKGVDLSQSRALRLTAIQNGLVPMLKEDLLEHKGLIKAAYVTFEDGTELIYPWHDFQAAVQSGKMSPELVWARDFGTAREALKKAKLTLTPVYEDPWGKGYIVSYLFPFKGPKGSPGILGMNIEPKALLRKAPLTYRGRVTLNSFLVSSSFKAILDTSGPVKTQEISFIKGLFNKKGFLEKPRAPERIGPYLVGVKPMPGLEASLVTLVNPKEIEGLLDPMGGLFSHNMARMLWSLLLSVLITGGLVLTAGRLLGRYTQRTLEGLLGQLERVEEGDTSFRVIYNGFDEIERFVLALNRTLDGLQEEDKALKEKNAELDGTLKTIEAQKETIVGLSSPVIPVYRKTLLLPIIGVLDSYRVQQMEERLLGAVEKTKARRVILDMTGCPFIDTYTAKAIMNILTSIRILGGTPYLVGLRPEVVRQIVGLGLDLPHVRIFMSLESALAGILRDARVE